MPKRRKIGRNMRADIYDRLAKLAKENGQTTTYVLEQAAKHCIRYVAPTLGTVRPEVMGRVRKSINRNHKLLVLLAK
jgi:hypothetical protein